MRPPDTKTNVKPSVFSSATLALIGTTCCALPIVLVAIGAGSAMASLVSALPWLATVSKYKALVFTLTALVQGYAWWQVRRVSQCSIADAKRLRWQRRILWASTALLVISIFDAYAAYPLIIWLDNR